MNEPEKNKDELDKQEDKQEMEPKNDERKPENKTGNQAGDGKDAKTPDGKPGETPTPSGGFGIRIPWLLLFLILGLLIWYSVGSSNQKVAEINFGFFRQQLHSGNIEKVALQNGTKLTGEFKTEPWDPETLETPTADSADAGKTAEPTEALPAPAANAEKAESAEKAEGTNETAEATEKPAEAAVTTSDQAETAASQPADQAKADPAKTAQANQAKAKGKKKTPKRLPKRFFTILPSPLEAGGELEKEISKAVGKDFHVSDPVDTVSFMMLLSIIITIVLLGSIWMQFRRARDGGGSSMFGFGRSPAKRFQAGEGAVTFKDVAGLESVKEDLREIVDFLQHPGKFERLGARIPKGVLMCGPPGTGKTLLARAIAGEANVPFFSINASEFIQMFVGVGASRVRDMFDTARSSAPAILFIDEIDAVGRLRGTGIGGGNDEREQTLNQILSEMDGFATNEVVIVIAATNRPDVLDPALLRPGRFDRHVTVSKPAQKGRVQLFDVHTRKVPLAEDVDTERLAAMTTGLTGADIRNIVNEAALWACRYNKEKVEMSDFYFAIDKVLMGAKREEVISAKEKRMTAYHEAGHTLIAWLVPGRDRVSKVSIIPRGRALGVTQMIPEEDRVSISQTEIEGKLLISLGGRAAEKLVFNELTAGAESDLQHVTQLAQKMVTSWGMSPRLGPAAFNTGEEHPFLGKEMSTGRTFSDSTAQIIDEEVMRILNESDAKTLDLLNEHRNQLDALAQALEIREELDEHQIEQILGPPAYRPAAKEDEADAS